MYYFYVQTPYIQNMFPPTRTIVHLPIMSPIMTPSIIGYKSATNSEQYVEWVIIYLHQKRSAAEKRHQGCSEHV